jgi:mannose-6-phosphate isomerase-like protein (cupin superfamily)
MVSSHANSNREGGLAQNEFLVVGKGHRHRFESRYVCLKG